MSEWTPFLFEDNFICFYLFVWHNFWLFGPMSAYNVHSANALPLSNAHQHHPQQQQQQQAQFFTAQMFPGLTEPPPPYGEPTAPILLNPSYCAASVGIGGAHSPVSASAVAAGDHHRQQHLATDKIASQQQQQTNTTMASSSSNNSNSDGSGHQQQQQVPPYYHQPQMPPSLQQSAPSDTSVLPPGAVPFSAPPPPVHGVYSSQHISMGHSFPVGGINVPNQTQIVKMIIAVPLGPHEVQLECSNCRQSVRTRVVRRPGLLTWIICGALALVGCWPCCVLPFCAQSCQDAEHFCSNCNAFIGKYSRI